MLLCNKPLNWFSVRIIRLHSFILAKKNLSSQDLFEIGHFDIPKHVSNYVTGQMFVHKTLGYRGLILFPWITKVHSTELTKHRNIGNLKKTNEYDHKLSYYYQVLIDSRDVPFTRIRFEAAPLIVMKLEKIWHALPSVDFAAHHDILPYTDTQKHQFQHELLENLFRYNPNRDICYEPKEELKSWQEKASLRFQFTEVHQEVAENVKVTVMPFFIGQRKTRKFIIFLWRYTVCLQNLGETEITVRKHNWRISSLTGSTVVTAGNGVAGEEPVLDKTQPVFQYSSHISLRAPCGHVTGMLEMERADGTSFQLKVPIFLLQSSEKY